MSFFLQVSLVLTRAVASCLNNDYGILLNIELTANVTCSSRLATTRRGCLYDATQNSASNDMACLLLQSHQTQQGLKLAENCNYYLQLELSSHHAHRTRPECKLRNRNKLFIQSYANDEGEAHQHLTSHVEPLRFDLTLLTIASLLTTLPLAPIP